MRVTGGLRVLADQWGVVMNERPVFVSRLRGDLGEASLRLASRRRHRRRLMAGAASFALVVAGIFVALLSREDGNEIVAAGDTTAIVADDPAMAAIVDDATWEEVPTAVGGEALPGVFWTGSEVVVMRTENGGNDVDGERWSPETNEVTRIAPSGLVWRVGSAMAWTGDEVLVVGGSNGSGLDKIGAAYKPSSDTWRSIADPPGDVDTWENAVVGPAVWTGDEMIVWRAGLAYAPSTDSWRSIPEPPLSPRARPATVWTGTELVVWGGCNMDGAQCDETNAGLLGDGALYDPGSDTWVPLPPSPLAPAIHMVAGWTGSEVIIVVTDPGSGSGGHAATFNPESLEWTTIESPRLEERRFAAGAWAGNQFVVWGGGDGSNDAGMANGATYDPATGQWSTIPEGPGPGRSLHSMVYAGDRLYISATRTISPPLQLRLPPPSSSLTPENPPISTPAGCVSAPTLPTDSELVGLPIAEVWPQGLKSGFDGDRLVYAEIEDPSLEGTWYAVGAVIRDLGNRPLGIGVWLTPDPIVAFAGAGEPGDPVAQLVNWHLYAHNDLAMQASIWQPFTTDGLGTEPVNSIQSCLTSTPEPLPFITGTLIAGDRWILSDDPGHGLCLVQSGVNYGCDDVGPVVSADDPPETMRIAGTLNPGPGISEDNAGDLAYGYLPDGATDVELILPNGRAFDTNVIVDLTTRIWAAPIEPGNNPTTVRYLDDSGQVVGEVERGD